MAKLFSECLEENNLPKNAVQLLDTTDHEAVQFLLREADNIDLIIPRGGERLISTVVENSHIPVIKHYKGICHIYVDDSASPEMAKNITINSKQYSQGNNTIN